MPVFKIILDLQDAGTAITRPSIQDQVDRWTGKREKPNFQFDKVDETITHMVRQKWFALS